MNGSEQLWGEDVIRIKQLVFKLSAASRNLRRYCEDKVVLRSINNTVENFRKVLKATDLLPPPPQKKNYEESHCNFTFQNHRRAYFKFILFLRKNSLFSFVVAAV